MDDIGGSGRRVEYERMGSLPNVVTDGTTTLPTTALLGAAGIGLIVTRLLLTPLLEGGVDMSAEVASVADDAASTDTEDGGNTIGGNTDD